MAGADRCASCGEVIPEGMMVCPNCLTAFVHAEKGKTMYKSPIDIIYGDMTKQIDDDIYRVVQNYSINVDKYELFRALKYDRNQYEKGYSDGVREFAERIFEAFPGDMNYTTISRFLVKTILNGMVGADDGC